LSFSHAGMESGKFLTGDTSTQHEANYEEDWFHYLKWSRK
jgi:hypothetical protein